MNTLVFFCGGAASLMALSVLLNELLIIVSGNEPAAGIAVSLWLAGAAFGVFLPASLAARKAVSYLLSLPLLQSRTQGSGRTVFSHPLHYLLAFLFWTEFVLLSGAWLLLRYVRPLFGLLPGQVPGLKMICLTAIAVFTLPGLLAGMRFSIGLIVAERSGCEGRGRTYIMTALGCLAGGVTVTALVGFGRSPLAALLAAGALCLAAALFLKPGRLLKYIVATMAPSLACLALFPGTIDLQTISWNFPDYETRAVAYSPAGQYLLAQRSGEEHLFGNLLPLNSVPGADILKNEEFPLYALLSHSQPRRVLLIGGAGRYVAPLLRQKIEALDWFEEDPRLFDLLKTYLPETAGPAVNDPRLRLLSGDCRRHLGKMRSRYDVIIVGRSYPVTLAGNRYYTREFFSLASRSLSSGGILAIQLPGSFVYVAPAMTELNTIVWETLKTAFQNVRVVPGDDNIYIASNKLLAAASEIKRRLRESAPSFLSPAHIDARMSLENTQWLRSQIRKLGRFKLLNRDYFPRGLAAGLIYRQSLLEPRTTTVFRFVLAWSWLLLLTIPFYFFAVPYRPVSAAFTNGLAGSALLLAAVLGLSIAQGDLYRWLATLIAIFAACFVLGSAVSRRQGSRVAPGSELMKVESGFVLWILLWGLLIPKNSHWWQAYFLLSAGAGLFLGMAFHLQSAVYASGTRRNESSAAGVLMSAMALGGCLAGLAGGTLLLPGWGFERTLLLLFIIKLISLRRLILR